MTEYIERERALQFHLKAYVKPEKFSVAQAVVDAIAEYIKVIPAADVAPVVHGRWIYSGIRGRFPVCTCSFCGNAENADWAVLGNNVNYCPNCGAKMDLEATP